MAALSVEEITQNIIAKLSITAPGLSLEVGTPERKILESVSEAIFESQVDSTLISSQIDIDTKSGADLEDFVGVFAFGRLQGIRATGNLTFNLTVAAQQPILIPVGTQLFSPGNLLGDSSLAYTTTANATIATGLKTVTVPAQCTIIGTIGNAPGGSITGFPSGLGVSTCTNIEAFTGGTDSESDDQLRARFKKTFLRNIVGTEDFYTAMSLQASGVSRVKILGPSNQLDVQVQTAAIGTGITLASKNCKFVWPNGYVASKDKSFSGLVWFNDLVDYTMTTGAITAPVFTPLTTDTDNEFLDATYEYTSTNSRNDPLRGIANKIDIYVDGSAPVTITEKISTKAITLVSDTTSLYYTSNFKSYPSGTTITTSTKFQRLGSTPIINYPSTIVVGATTYVLGTNYKGVRDITLSKGSEREVSGIIWLTTPPADAQTAFVTYTYNQIPEVLNSVFKKSKQITSDPLVHTAKQKFLRISIIIQYVQGATVSDVNTRLTNALSAYLSSLPFGAWIQLSDIVTFVHNVQGVDNVRITKSTDGTATYGLAVMEAGVAPGTVYTADFQLEDNEIPALASVDITRRSFNSFGS